MRPIRTFSVIPALPPPIEALRSIAYNLRWAWSHDSIELFRRLDRDLWETTGHNPVLMLGTIEQEKLEAASGDDAFLAHLQRVLEKFESYLPGESSSAALTQPLREQASPLEMGLVTFSIGSVESRPRILLTRSPARCNGRRQPVLRVPSFSLAAIARVK
jgi:glucan phosphorylase